MSTSFIVEARMSSSRLPGKVLLKIKNKPILAHLINRLKSFKKVKKIILATTKNKSDDILEKFAKKNKLIVYRGSESKVAQRVYLAAKKNGVKDIISITADCPLIDLSIIDQCFEIYRRNNAVFVTNSHYRSYPDGMDVQIFKTFSLGKALKLAKTKKDLEHTTYVLRKYPKLFNTIHVIAPDYLNYPKLGLTLDEKEDFKLISKIILSLKKKKNFSCLDIIYFLNKNKSLKKINSNVKRNSYFLSYK